MVPIAQKFYTSAVVLSLVMAGVQFVRAALKQLAVSDGSRAEISRLAARDPGRHGGSMAEVRGRWMALGRSSRSANRSVDMTKAMLAAGAALAVAACADAPRFSAADDVAVREAVVEWHRVIAEGNPDRAIALMNERYVDVHADRVLTREQTRGGIESTAERRPRVDVEVQRVEGHGSLAYVWYSLELAFPNDDPASARSGNGLVIARRGDDGEWRLEAMSVHTEGVDPSPAESPGA